MFRTIVKKVPELILVMLAATLLTFFLTWVSPGDPAEIYFESRGIAPTADALLAMQSKMGLDQPFAVQYWNWLSGIVQLDAGVSLRTGEPVAQMVKQRFAMTFKLSLLAITLMLVLSFLLAIVASLNEGGPADYAIRLFSFAGVSMPDFWLGLMLILNFVVYLQWFPLTDPYALKSVVLPALTLAIPLTGRYTRQIQSMISEEMTKSYVVGARARGCTEWAIILQHVLPAILGGLTTLFGLSCALLLGGTVVVESIFSWPGLGSMAIESITHRDYPVLQAYVVIMVFIYVSINFIADIVAEILDPRLSLSGGKR
ncbi:ABC transporter permease [Ferrimonas lipolytica]|uniref:ABC transporter permease n=1 Tax=Ferrimonas lipolytica TaxID=2724191 RepID=A0A6H1UB62_9GAMM|nr:ABC transporter permease [Ferrimonas lipolytica]QIZ76317.1 ABC transporter permease [Ferrimonas lipolytica]